jgi:hypothetical protein
MARTTQILRLELPSLAKGLQALSGALPSCMLGHNCLADKTTLIMPVTFLFRGISAR